MKPKIAFVLGPTAVSKSDIAMELALQMSGEIINADSQQVYRQMNIGTAKPSKRECRGFRIILSTSLTRLKSLMSPGIESWRPLASMKFKKKANRRSFAVEPGFISKR